MDETQQLQRALNGLVKPNVLPRAVELLLAARREDPNLAAVSADCAAERWLATVEGKRFAWTTRGRAFFEALTRSDS